jgi:hypothetical protein
MQNIYFSNSVAINKRSQPIPASVPVHYAGADRHN